MAKTKAIIYSKNARHTLSTKRFFFNVNLKFEFLLNEQKKCIKQYYRVCHGFRLTKQDDYFHVNFDHF